MARSYLHVSYCFIVHDLPLLKNSVCSPVCVGLVRESGWTNIVIQNSEAGWTFERLPSVWHGRKRQFPYFLTLFQQCWIIIANLFLKWFPNWKPFHFLTYMICGTLRYFEIGREKRRKCCSRAIKEFLCVLLRLSWSCNHHMIGFIILYDCH